MKLFSFWRSKPATAPVMIDPSTSAPVVAPEPVVPLLSLLVLKVVAAFPNRGEDRALRRFFEKTNITPAQVVQERQQLFDAGLLIAGPLKQGVQYFVASEKGMEWLREHYQLERMLPFVMEIEPKGFIATLLRNVAEQAAGEV